MITFAAIRNRSQITGFLLTIVAKDLLKLTILTQLFYLWCVSFFSCFCKYSGCKFKAGKVLAFSVFVRAIVREFKVNSVPIGHF